MDRVLLIGDDQDVDEMIARTVREDIFYLACFSCFSEAEIIADVMALRDSISSSTEAPIKFKLQPTYTGMASRLAKTLAALAA